MDETKVVFKISNGLVQKLFDSAEEKCLLNIKDFAGRKAEVITRSGSRRSPWAEPCMAKEISKWPIIIRKFLWIIRGRTVDCRAA